VESEKRKTSLEANQRHQQFRFFTSFPGSHRQTKDYIVSSSKRCGSPFFSSSVTAENLANSLRCSNFIYNTQKREENLWHTGGGSRGGKFITLQRDEKNVQRQRENLFFN
jgi:hypothetical protein